MQQIGMLLILLCGFRDIGVTVAQSASCTEWYHLFFNDVTLGSCPHFIGHGFKITTYLGLAEMLLGAFTGFWGDSKGGRSSSSSSLLSELMEPD